MVRLANHRHRLFIPSVYNVHHPMIANLLRLPLLDNFVGDLCRNRFWFVISNIDWLWFVQELIREFGLNLRDLLSQFEDYMHGKMALCRDLENLNNERMAGLVTVIIDKLVHKLTEEVEKELSGVVKFVVIVIVTL